MPEMMRAFILLAVAIWGLTAVPIAAEEKTEECAARPVILSLAEHILEGREAFGEFTSIIKRSRRRRFGTDAAYLLIHYGDMDEAATTALIQRISDEKLNGALELRSAYLIAEGKFDFAELKVERAFLDLRYSGWRSLILSDDGVRFFRLARENKLDWHLSKARPLEDWISYYAARSIADVSDKARAKVAATAERLGEVSVALTLLADQEDLTAFRELAARHPDHRYLTEVRRFPETYGSSLRMQSAPIDLGRSEGAFRDEWRVRLFELQRVNHRFGSYAFFQTFLNITGKEYFISDVAAGLNDAIDAGALDPIKRPEQALISAYRQLIERMGQRAVDDGLSFALGGRQFGKSKIVRTVIHEAIAARSLASYVAGKEENSPKRPKLLGAISGFDWPLWKEIADKIREGQADAFVDQTEVEIAIELAFAAGDYELAVSLAGRIDSVSQRLRAYKALMKRLDHRCERHTWTRGTGFGVWPQLYRFPAAR